MHPPTDLIAQAFRLANAAVVADIETEGVKTVIGDLAFYDVSHMLDEREHAAESIDMARQAIDYALAVGLVMQHPTQQHLLRVLSHQR